MARTEEYLPLDRRFEAMIHAKMGEEAPEFLEAINDAPATAVFLNRLKHPAPDHFHFRPVPWCTDAGFLEERPVFTLDPLFHAGCYYVLEASSVFLMHVLKSVLPADTPLRVLDLCAAPGGKSVMLLSGMSPGSLLVSNEVNRARWNILQYNLDKWGYANTLRSCADPSAMPWSATFDLIVVDAPCSGEGMFRKDLAARAQWSPEHVIHCSLRQRRILHEAVRMLRPGGVLIYTTCTFNDHENIDQVVWLSQEYGMHSLEVEIDPGWGISTTKNRESVGYAFFPHKVRGEGLFCSALKKPGHPPEDDAIHKRRKRPPEQKTAFSQQELTHWLKPDADWDTIRLYPYGAKGVTLLQSQIDCEPFETYRGLVMGTHIGHYNKTVFTPAHALALLNDVNVHLPAIDLNKHEALNYLRKNPLPLQSDRGGWHLVRFNGHTLGWSKQTRTGMKNYLPTNLRILLSE